MAPGFPYRLVDHWVPRNILRPGRAPSSPDPAPRASARRRAKAEPPQPQPPRFDGDLWRRTFDVMLVTMKPFQDAGDAVLAAVRPLLLELELH